MFIPLSAPLTHEIQSLQSTESKPIPSLSLPLASLPLSPTPPPLDRLLHRCPTPLPLLLLLRGWRINSSLVSLPPISRFRRINSSSVPHLQAQLKSLHPIMEHNYLKTHFPNLFHFLGANKMELNNFQPPKRNGIFEFCKSKWICSIVSRRIASILFNCKSPDSIRDLNLVDLVEFLRDRRHINTYGDDVGVREGEEGLGVW